jgi:transcriptional regulator with XRE-family HTH domain
MMEIDLSRLRELREAIGLTRKEFADSIGLGCIEHTVFRWETGKTKKPLPVYRKALEKFFKRYAHILVLNGPK